MSREDLNIQSSLMLLSASRSARLPLGQCSTTRAKIPESKKRPTYRFRFSCRISLNWSRQMKNKMSTCIKHSGLEEVDMINLPQLDNRWKWSGSCQDSVLLCSLCVHVFISPRAGRGLLVPAASTLLCTPAAHQLGSLLFTPTAVRSRSLPPLIASSLFHPWW